MVYYGQLGSCQLISINKPCVDEMDINSELRSSMHRNLIETKTDVMTKNNKKTIFITVLPRIFVLFEYSNNWARMIVFVFVFAEFSNSKYYSNDWAEYYE